MEQSLLAPGPQRLVMLRKELEITYKEEELFWRQKSREQWLSEGDRNSKYFHESVRANRAKKRIDKLVDSNGFEQMSEASKGDVAVKYFQNLFSSSNTEDFEDFFRDFNPRVTQVMNEALIKEVSKEEIKEAIFAIKPSSAPGPDGMSSLFFQKFWNVVGHQVIEEVQQFFVTGTFPVEWNHTHLFLLPKTTDPTSMANLRPISLCSVLYKVVSKILMKKLQPFMPELVSPTQSAFVEERLISDNILIVHEVVHSLKAIPTIAKSYMAIKTDMSKAYDRVEWNYLKALLSAMGFHHKWISWLMFCMTTTSFSVMINDQPFGLIKPARGIRQGYPISPFLFLFCTEGLIHLLNQAQAAGQINGISFEPSGPVIHHLLFADDCLLICKASEIQAQQMMKVLKRYEDATGQAVNLNKSSISFGAKVDCSMKMKIKELTAIQNEGGAGTYLGLPECFSGSKVKLFDFICDKLKSRLTGWFARLLSQGGKEVLLKAIALAMPTYAMSCFKLPKKTIQKITSAMAEFWWSAVEHRSNIHWVSWKKLCLPKAKGGLGFKDIQRFNQLLLAKQAWRLLNNPESLFGQIFKSRYFRLNSFLDASLGQIPSYAWRSILFGKDLLSQGLKRMIGNGKSINVWLDSWLYDTEWRRPWIKNTFIDLNLKVQELIDAPNRCWNRVKLEEVFFPHDVNIILKNSPAVDREDYWSWAHTKNGMYSVKSGSELSESRDKGKEMREANSQPSLNPLKESVWKTQTSPKIKAFMWKMLNNALPVGELIKTKGIRSELICQACGNKEESVNHVLFACPVARQVWALSNFPNPQNGFSDSSIYSNLDHLLSAAKRNDVPLKTRRSFPWILWFLWKNRNKCVFEGFKGPIDEILAKAKEEAEVWFSVQIRCPVTQQNNQEANERDWQKSWQPPPRSWLKCNIGVSWSSKALTGGSAWILRDTHGQTLLHSRNAFVGIESRQAMTVTAIIWTIEAMLAHKLDRIMFAIDDMTMLGAVTRPRAWPNFRAQADAILISLKELNWWRLVYEPKEANRGASLIARSVIEKNLIQSYVVNGPPRWLSPLLDNERPMPSV